MPGYLFILNSSRDRKFDQRRMLLAMSFHINHGALLNTKSGTGKNHQLHTLFAYILLTNFSSVFFLGCFFSASHKALVKKGHQDNKSRMNKKIFILSSAFHFEVKLKTNFLNFEKIKISNFFKNVFAERIKMLSMIDINHKHTERHFCLFPARAERKANANE